MKRKVLQMKIDPGSALSNSPWLPLEHGGTYSFDQISFAATMTCLGQPITIDEADITISNAPHTEEDLVVDNSVYSNNRDPLALP